MIKVLLYLIIIGCGSGAGYLISRSYLNRIIHLQDMITALQILESEMKYRRDPLPYLLNKIGNLNIGMTGSFFNQISENLMEGRHLDFHRTWLSATEKTYGDSSLTKDDEEIISEIGIELGKTDIDSQHNVFNRAYFRLENNLKDAYEEKKTKGRMYQSLGIAIGVLIVIVLL